MKARVLFAPIWRRKLRLLALFSTAVFFLTGCLVPIGSRVTSGGGFSKASLELLRAKSVSRDEVIENFGLPLVEFESMRTMVYVWYEEPRFLFIWPYKPFSDHPVPDASVDYGSEEQWVLLVAYDETKHVVAHEKRCIDTQSLEEECANWNRSRTK